MPPIAHDPAATATASGRLTRESRLALLPRLLRERILVLDGAMGTLLQRYRFTEADWRGARFADHPTDVRGNSDLLCLTQPEAVRAAHRAYFEAGADIVSTNSFTSTRIAQADYGLSHLARELNESAARLAREAADAVEARDGRPALRRGLAGPHQPDRARSARTSTTRRPATSPGRSWSRPTASPPRA